jgi:hypothetical protein
MALKAKLLQSVYDTLPADIKKEYKQEGEDFILDVEDADSLPTFGTLKADLGRAKTNEVAQHNKTKAELEVAKARVIELEEGDKTRTNDTKAIEDRHKKALEAANKTAAEEKLKLENQLSGILVDGEALRLAAELSDTPAVLVPHIKARLKADLTGEKPVTVVLDANGEPSGKKIEDLKKDFIANKDFSRIITASKASGSGARQSGNQDGGASDYQGKNFGDLTEAQRTKWATEDAAGFEAASNAHKQISRRM